MDNNRTGKSPLLSADSSHLISKGPTSDAAQSAHSQQKSTYEDVLAALQLLEEEPLPLQLVDSAYLPTGNLDDLGPTPLSIDQGKLQNILAYLDEMEKEDEHLKSQLTTSHLEARLQGVAPDIHTQRLVKRSDFVIL